LCSDIWEQIFEHFEILELFKTFSYITIAADQVLFDGNNHFLLRGLTLDVGVKDIPEQIPLNRVISLTLHEAFSFKIIEHCLELRSLKLIGGTEWVTAMVKKISQKNTKLEQLTAVILRNGSLPELITSILSIFSLRRLEIHDHDVSETGKYYTLAMAPSKIEQFILHSSSTIDWNNLSYMLPDFINIRLLNIKLLDRNQKSIPTFIFHNLHTLSLGLHEVSFNWIIYLVTTMPCLVKLKLSGLVDGEGFVVNQRWIRLFESAPTLARIFVDVSLEQCIKSYHCEKIQAALRALKLTLICNDDETDCYLYYGQVHRWWSLRGVISKQ
jgi:hypothetical protein